jgi:DNA-binding NarL/FixJ family response regulator
VSRGGVALLAKTARVSGLERGLRRGLAPWTRGRAVHDPGRGVLQKAYSLAALLAEGATSRVIADTLVVTLDTVTRHVTDVLENLRAASRTRAVARWPAISA